MKLSFDSSLPTDEEIFLSLFLEIQAIIHLHNIILSYRKKYDL